ncbi:MAG: hypothetical protein CME72_02535 [Halomonadaceae bacterium]|nr:hypothetical protein [Halomonadaceae bacterium]
MIRRAVATPPVFHARLMLPRSFLAPLRAISFSVLPLLDHRQPCSPGYQGSVLLRDVVKPLIDLAWQTHKGDNSSMIFIGMCS